MDNPETPTSERPPWLGDHGLNFHQMVLRHQAINEAPLIVALAVSVFLFGVFVYYAFFRLRNGSSATSIPSRPFDLEAASLRNSGPIPRTPIPTQSAEKPLNGVGLGITRGLRKPLPSSATQSRSGPTTPVRQAHNPLQHDLSETGVSRALSTVTSSFGNAEDQAVAQALWRYVTPPPPAYSSPHAPLHPTPPHAHHSGRSTSSDTMKIPLETTTTSDNVVTYLASVFTTGTLSGGRMSQHFQAERKPTVWGDISHAFKPSKMVTSIQRSKSAPERSQTVGRRYAISKSIPHPDGPYSGPSLRGEKGHPKDDADGTLGLGVNHQMYHPSLSFRLGPPSLRTFASESTKTITPCGPSSVRAAENVDTHYAFLLTSSPALGMDGGPPKVMLTPSSTLGFSAGPSVLGYRGSMPTLGSMNIGACHTGSWLDLFASGSWGADGVKGRLNPADFECEPHQDEIATEGDSAEMVEVDILNLSAEISESKIGLAF